VTHGGVTAVVSNGFYLQDPAGDGDPGTSDALLVFSAGAPAVSVGDLVEAEGTVSEFVPGGAATGNFSTTELVAPETARLNTAALPEPVRFGFGRRIPPNRIIDDDAFGVYDPEADGIDFYESLEAMRVRAARVRSVAGTNRFAEIYGALDFGLHATGRSGRGTLHIAPDDFNPERNMNEFEFVGGH